MARRRLQQTKRQRERNFQGWYDPENPEEAPVIEAFDFLFTQTGATQKQIIGYALRRWAEDEGFNPSILLESASAPAPLQLQIDQLSGLIAQLTGAIQGGQFVPTGESGRAMLDQFETDLVELDEISRSVGSRYRSLSFDEDEN